MATVVRIGPANKDAWLNKVLSIELNLARTLLLESPVDDDARAGA